MKVLRLACASFVGLLLLAGCGSPDAGDGCNGSDYICLDVARALECRGGSWRELQCRGTLGCRELKDSVRCDTSGNVAGDNCASSAEGHAMCRSDGKALLECREGLLVQTLACSACATEDSRVQCTP
ncbi:hypothetical protein DRW03_30965 [Corallococcus sp. H22C18031201]|uniref:hypothetical protein n=1 Tax=Citreicoccus inhibens TaxID=2849499 RepID=UPI000E71C74B|nr:hypothetical protein [Citreicoccus inhibens]MBU8900193.1 hypothetical protein [Citreicoccus inhibens]RJS16361.1 hypothetical protein DRW03_30965 [Corallococcus sp. H22C18031201]